MKPIAALVLVMASLSSIPAQAEERPCAVRVTCDLACDVRVNGELAGHAEAGEALAISAADGAVLRFEGMRRGLKMLAEAAVSCIPGAATKIEAHLTPDDFTVEDGVVRDAFTEQEWALLPDSVAWAETGGDLATQLCSELERAGIVDWRAPRPRDLHSLFWDDRPFGLLGEEGECSRNDAGICLGPVRSRLDQVLPEVFADSWFQTGSWFLVHGPSTEDSDRPRCGDPARSCQRTVRGVQFAWAPLLDPAKVEAPTGDVRILCVRGRSR